MGSTTKLLNEFFGGYMKEKYLILGDPFHGSVSLRTLCEYMKDRGADRNTFSFKRISTFYIIVEGMDESGKISPTIAPEIAFLRGCGFVILAGENSEVAPEKPSDEWVENERVPLANAHWVNMARRTAFDDKVVICCGTSHVGSSRQKKGDKEEVGLVKRLVGESVGFAVIDGEKIYQPEKDSTTWEYESLNTTKPL